MRARRSRSTVLTAATLGVLIATGAVVASPAAYAADAPTAPTATATATATPPATPSAEPTAMATAEAGKPSLTVNAPASVGRGGQPVEFTETISNPGTTEASFQLVVNASDPSVPGSISPDPITVDYRDADGTWKRAFGAIPGLTVAAGATKTVQLRLTTALHAYWDYKDSTVTLTSTVFDQAGTTALAESTKQVAAKAVTLQVKDAPTTAVAGGAPVEFDVTINNPSASSYTNVSKIVEADPHSTLQVRKADGSWENITGTPAPHADGRLTYQLADDQNLAPHETFTKHVRLAFTADAPIGKNYIHTWAKFDQGSQYAPFYIGPQYIEINLAAAPLGLSVQEPASIGNGGRPVEFSETLTNTAGSDASFNLKLDASNPLARSDGRIALESRDSDGTWKPIGITFKQQADGFHFIGTLNDVTVPAGATKTLQLRLAAPLNNDWAGQSGTIKLSSSVLDKTGQYTLTESTKDVALKALGLQTKGAPTTAVIGGAPVDFDVTFNNPSASSYDNASLSVLADPHSTLQVQKADGSWQTVTGIPSRQNGGPATYHLTEDKNLAANSSVTKHVRIAFTADAPIGNAVVDPTIILGEGGQYMPAYVGPQGFQVNLTTGTDGSTGTTNNGTGAAVKAGLTTTGGDSDSTGTTDGTGSTQLAGGELAHTGSSGMLQALTGAAALLASGIGAVFFARRRRSA
ncbi:COG1470 family protein [Kitasatospora sp. NPDC001159]